MEVLAVGAAIDPATLSLVVFALVFALLERVLPHRAVDRRRDLALDALGVAAGIAFVTAAYPPLRWLGQAWVTPALHDGLQALRALPSAARIAAVVLLVDLAIYGLHAAMHRWAFPWRMHRWHHTIEQMYWLAGFRASYLHILLYAVPQVGIPVVVFDLGPGETAIAAAIGNFVQLWTHTCLRIDIGPLRHVFVTPAYHRLHHRARPGPARNLGNLLTLWDRLFGTYEAPEGQADETLGLGEPRPPLPRLLLGL